MEEEDGKKNKEKSQKQSNEEPTKDEPKAGAEHKLEKQPKYKSLPELLQTEKAAKKNTMATAIKANMKAVKKTDK